MAGTLKSNAIQLGDSATATQNFTLRTNADGTATLARGNVGATTQDILTVDAAGVVNILGGVNGIVSKTPVAIGYGTGAGGSVTQLTSKSTAVTLNKPCGQITTAADALGSGASVQFTLNNSLISIYDTIVVNCYGGQSYQAQCVATGTAGSAFIQLTNITGGSLSQAVLINFAVIKGSVT